MDRFLRPQALPGTAADTVYHSSGSRTLYPGESQAESSSSQSQSQSQSRSSSSTIEPLLLDSPADDDLTPSHQYPTDNVHMVRGVLFEVDFQRVWCSDNLLESSRLGYAVRHRSQLKGGREAALIWKYGVELAYIDNNGSSLRLWLCQLCHANRSKNDAKKVNSYHHIIKHMRKAHKIDPTTGQQIKLTVTYQSPFEAAARVPGGASQPSHTPWQEGAFLNAFIDWIIQNDVSFLHAVSLGTRGLLTWNRISMMRALPNSATTVSRYVLSQLETRKEVVVEMVGGSASKVAVSVDVWTSTNYMSFLGVVAHFASKWSP